MGNLVAIVGRPNVGKSTLFNRLTQSRQAIVNDEAGTTRDRQYGKVNWVGHEFSIVDTGGWVVNSDDIFEEEINKQVAIAIEEADVILFVVDATHGITDLDDKVAAILRRSKKPTLLVANKVENNASQYSSAEFYSFGLGDPFCISAINGSGTGELLDATIALFPTKVTEEELEEEIPRIAVVGRPNAGKSSIINAFIGEDRYIVTDIAGTTRDSVNTRYNKFGFDFYIIDTAGIRKKGKVNEDIEYYSVIRSIRAIENSDVCILMIDATRGIESQDLNGWWSASTNGTLSKTRAHKPSKPLKMPYAPVWHLLPTSPSCMLRPSPSNAYSKSLNVRRKCIKTGTAMYPRLVSTKRCSPSLRTIRPLQTKASM